MPVIPPNSEQNRNILSEKRFAFSPENWDKLPPANSFQASIVSGIFQEIVPLVSSSSYLVAVIAVLVAGLVRGFSGFGTGLILVPVIAALYSPATALVFIMALDIWPNFPIVWQCRKQVDWNEIFPVLAGAVVTIPIGLFFLKYGEVNVIRWFVSIAIAIFVLLVLLGWKYRGKRTVKTSLAVGGMCGFLSGSAGLPGPPAIMYWASRQSGIENMRANLTTFLLLAEAGAFFGLLLTDMLTLEAVIMGLVASPVYLVGQLIGSSLFGKASERTYRLVALCLIIMVAISASPAMDNILLR